MAEKYDVAELKAFGARLFTAAGMPEDRAAVVSDMLIDADMMGHDTHGLNLAPQYLGALKPGTCQRTEFPKCCRIVVRLCSGTLTTCQVSGW